MTLRIRKDGKIEHYLRLSSSVTDQATLDGIKELIQRMETQEQET
jgi:hypothetical protein